MKVWKLIILIALLGVQRISLCPELNLTIEQIEQNIAENQYYQDIWDIVNTIKQVESGGRYDIPGKSREYGAYQFTPATWKRLCLKFKTGIIDWESIENQDRIAYEQVKWLISKGLSPEQIASYWNCGSKKWKGKRGRNKYGVKYDVPQYISKFNEQYYKGLKVLWYLNDFKGYNF